MFKLVVLAFVLGVAFAANANSEQDAEVRSFSSDVNPDGTYHYQYDTSNGISGQESGAGGASAQGSASWTAPDGTPIQLSYTADENGYQPSGSAIHPIPEAILRSLEWNRKHPEEE